MKRRPITQKERFNENLAFNEKPITKSKEAEQSLNVAQLDQEEIMEYRRDRLAEMSTYIFEMRGKT